MANPLLPLKERQLSTAVDCKRSIEIEIPLDEVERAQERVTNSIKQRVRLPGFRPGKAPINIIKSRFEGEIRNEVLELLLRKPSATGCRRTNYRSSGPLISPISSLSRGSPSGSRRTLRLPRSSRLPSIGAFL